MIDPAFIAAEELDNGRPEHAVVHALLAIVVRLERIEADLTEIAGRPYDT